MWTCTECGTPGIPLDVDPCPHCGTQQQEDSDVPGISRGEGPTIYDPEKGQGVNPWTGKAPGEASEQFSMNPESSSDKTTNEDPSLAPTTGSPSQPGQTDSSTAGSTDGVLGPEDSAHREGIDSNGMYDEWTKDDLRNEASNRGLDVRSSATKDDLMRALREDDQTMPL